MAQCAMRMQARNIRFARRPAGAVLPALDWALIGQRARDAASLRNA
ncbi:MAG: hypothetical protein ACLQAR_09005 [Steroidobacteraceae bacterium]